MANKNNVFLAPIIHENTQTQFSISSKNKYIYHSCGGVVSLLRLLMQMPNAQIGSYFVSSKNSVALHTQKAHNNTIIDKTRPSSRWKLCSVPAPCTQTSRTNEMKMKIVRAVDAPAPI